MFDWFFLQPWLLVWLIGLQFVIDSYLEEKVYIVASQVRQPGCYGVQCGLLDGSQLSRTHLFEHLVRGSYMWSLESEADKMFTQLILI